MKTPLRIHKLLITVLLVSTVFTSCKKDNNSNTGKCDFEVSIKSSGSILSDAQNADYTKIWKSILLKHSNMTEDYFDRHITDYVISTHEWNAGISFRVDYIMSIDWVEIKCSDSFIIKMKSSYDYYSHLNIPRDVYLEEDQINANALGNVDSEISTYNLIEKLKYKDCNEIYNAASASSGYDDISADNLTYYVPGLLPRENGDPYLLLNGVINEADNRCLSGYINLSTGDCVVRERSCRSK